MKRRAKPILLGLVLLFLYSGLGYQFYRLRNPKPDNIIDIEIIHDGKENRNILLLAEKEDKTREPLVKALLMKGATKEVIPFKRDPKNPIKLYLITDTDSRLIFDNTKGGKNE